MRALGIFATGFVSLAVFNFLAGAAGPLLGMLVSMIALALKLGLFMAIGYLLFKLFRRKRDEAHG